MNYLSSDWRSCHAKVRNQASFFIDSVVFLKRPALTGKIVSGETITQARLLENSVPGWTMWSLMMAGR